MIPAGPVITALLKSVKNSDNNEDRAIALMYFNLAYFDYAARQSWQELRRTITLTFDGTNAVLLPSNMAGIDGLYDLTCRQVFSRRERNQIFMQQDNTRRYYIDSYSSSALVSVAADDQGVTIEKGATVVTYSPALTGTYTGEFLVIEDVPGFFQLDASNNLVEPFVHEKVDGASFQIRPSGTQKMMAVNPDNSNFKGALSLDYWVYPTAIFDGSQVIHLPTSDALLRRARMDYYQLELLDDKKASEIGKMLAVEESKMEAANPVYMAPSFPENRNGCMNGLWGAQR